MKKLFLLFNVGLLVLGFTCLGQYVQVGSKLVGTGAINGSGFGANQGYSVSLSGDGNILAVGGPRDNSSIGAVWVYTFSGGNWIQMGNKLVGTGYVNNSQQGTSVSISSDGNTLAVGGSNDNGGFGAVWVYTLSGINWLQIGSKLVGTGASNGGSGSKQGYSVSLSEKGKVLAVGAPNDNEFNNEAIGATWVYTFTGGNWVQIGNKIVGTKGSGFPQQGKSVSLTANGQILAVGGPKDSTDSNLGINGVGAAWLFSISGSNWQQIGNKLQETTTNLSGIVWHGQTVKLSGDGRTLIVGGNGNNIFGSVLLIYTLLGSNWTLSNSSIGISDNTVTVSSDGKTIAVGGLQNNSQNTGASWVYTFSGSNWSQVGNKIIGKGGDSLNNGSYQGYSLSLSSNGKILAVGGFKDQNQKGAVWVFENTPSSITEIEEISESLNFSTPPYPNPFTQSLTLTSESEEPYTIYNLQGISVETGVSSSRSVGSQLPPGVYQLKIVDKVTKVVKIDP